MIVEVDDDRVDKKVEGEEAGSTNEEVYEKAAVVGQNVFDVPPT